MKTFNLLFASTVIFMLSLGGVQAASSDKRIEVVHLTFTMRDAGLCELWLADDAIKILNINAKTTMLAKAPSWKIFYFRNDERKLWVGDVWEIGPARLTNPFFHNAKPKDSDNTPASKKNKVGQGYLKKLHYNVYQEPNNYRKWTIWATDSLAINPKCSEIFCKLVGAPKFNDLPIYGRFYQADNERTLQHEKSEDKGVYKLGHFMRDIRVGPQEAFQLQSWEKTTAPEVIFAAPSGYTKVASATSITYSNKILKDAESVFEDLNGTSPTK